MEVGLQQFKKNQHKQMQDWWYKKQVKGAFSAMQINMRDSISLSSCDKTAPTSPSRSLGTGEGGQQWNWWEWGCHYNKFTSHSLGEPKTAVIGPDYLLEYINIALTCQ